MRRSRLLVSISSMLSSVAHNITHQLFPIRWLFCGQRPPPEMCPSSPVQYLLIIFVMETLSVSKNVSSIHVTKPRVCVRVTIHSTEPDMRRRVRHERLSVPAVSYYTLAVYLKCCKPGRESTLLAFQYLGCIVDPRILCKSLPACQDDNIPCSSLTLASAALFLMYEHTEAICSFQQSVGLN
jgi:hypothetical protein